MQEEKCKECLKCKHYSPYYTKGYFKFNKLKIGLCRQKVKIVKSRENCDHWSKMQIRHPFFDKPTTEKALHEILAQLSEIKQIMEENAENEKY